MRIRPQSIMLFVFQAILILVPLTWLSATSELFEFPKMLITYAGAILVGGLWVARMIQEKRLIYRRSIFEFPILLFIASQAISTFISIDMHTSLFGYYSRFNGGLLSLLSYALLYFAAVTHFDQDDAKTLIKTIIYTGIISCLYALPEHFGHSPSCLLLGRQFDTACWAENTNPLHRVFGTFGQPNWLAAYLISIIFIPLSQMRQLKSKQWLIFSLFFLVLLFTKSRSGIIGFLFSFFVFSVLTFLSNKSKEKNVNKKLITASGILIFCFLAFGKNISGTTDKLFFSYGNNGQGSKTTMSQPANSLEVNITPSSDIRRIVWKGAWELAKRNPLFGTGVETFAYTYYNVRPAEHNLVSEWNFLYNKAHNEFLNYAATTGFFGLSTYLFFLGSFVVWSIKGILKYRKYKGMESMESKKTSHTSTTFIPPIPYLTALLSGFLALCISNFFGFSTVPVNTLLFLFPALAILLTEKMSEEKAFKSATLTTAQYLGSGMTGIITLLLLIAVNRGLTADLNYTVGRAAGDSQNYQVAIDKLQNAIRAVPDEPLYTDELAQTFSEIAARSAAGGQTAQASQAAALAIQLSDRTLNLNRYHLNYYRSRAKIFINLTTINPEYIVEAGATIQAAIKLSPTDSKLWYNLALIAKQLGRNEEAEKLFQKSVDLKPNDEESHYQYGLLLETLGKTSEAKVQYEYSLAHINPDNPLINDAMQRVATASAKK